MISFRPDLQKIRLDVWNHREFTNQGIQADVLRLDLLHTEISGNKWFKLKYFLKDAETQNKSLLVSFGGAYSNHLLALASAAFLNGFSSVGIVRGEEPPLLSPTLLSARQLGMRLCFLPRADYLRRKLAAACMELDDHETYPGEKQINDPMGFGEDSYFIPEGGSGTRGVRGAEEILSLVPFMKYTHICCAVGTGTTLAGLVNRSGPMQKIIGISVLKGTKGLEPLTLSWIKNQTRLQNVQIIHSGHAGGYAKWNQELIDFMNNLYLESQIPTDFVYTAKLFNSIVRLTAEKAFPSGSRILVLHTGGLQGNRSLLPGQLQF